MSDKLQFVDDLASLEIAVNDKLKFVRHFFVNLDHVETVSIQCNNQSSTNSIF